MTQFRLKTFRVGALLCVLLLCLSGQALAREALFEYIGPPDAVDLPEHAVAGQDVRLNRRALQSPSMRIDLFDESYIAERTHIDRQRSGRVIWTGHLQGQPFNTVIITLDGNVASGFIQHGMETYRIGRSSASGSRLYMLDLRELPPDDAVESPSGGPSPPASSTQANTVQDLLVAYTQGACTSAGSCAQLVADINTAVADINAAYSASGINITMNLVGTHQTVYAGTGASQALSDLRGTSDGQMDEVHGVRDSLGADIVSLIYDGEGCGIGYLPSSASTAFNVTDEPCLVGNRTMAHEIGHNQGAHHDRVTANAGSSSAYNYGFRRCNDGSVDDFGSPYFRTILAYSCSGSPRVGRFSNPNVNYSGVPQGVDPAVTPGKGAWNARTLNESANYVAGFRTAAPNLPPNAPSALLATANGHDAIDLGWNDNSADETSFVVQSAPDGSSWSDIATLAANTTSYTDDGLAPLTTRYYRVRAQNSAGASGYSNVDSDTTGPLPPSIDDLAYGEVSGTGSVSGNYTATHADGGGFQTIDETSSSGPKRSRRQSYDHDWLFDVFGGAGGVIATVDAWVSGSEGANFYYSTDGGATLHPMFTVDNTSPGAPRQFALPGDTVGLVRIIAQDAEQTNGEPADSLYVDHLVITSYTSPGLPPATPSGMSVTGTTAFSVSLSFTDNATDEFGFELRRSTSNPGGNCEAGEIIDTLGSNTGTGTVNYVDGTASPGNTYWYWASSFNGAGSNGACSNAASGTTPAAPAISLSLSSYKVKGANTVDLSWSGAGGTHVDIYRNGSLLLTTPNDGAHTDNTGQKGAATFGYRVCAAGSTTVCSEEQFAVF